MHIWVIWTDTLGNSVLPFIWDKNKKFWKFVDMKIYLKNFKLNLTGNRIVVGDFSSLQASEKYSSQKSKSCSSGGCCSSVFFRDIVIRVIFPIVDFKYQFGGFKLNIHSAAWEACKRQDKWIFNHYCTVKLWFPDVFLVSSGFFWSNLHTF